jgi:hypothetical protein
MKLRRVRQLFSGSNLARPAAVAPAVKPLAPATPVSPGSLRLRKWPLPPGRPAKIGDGRKLTLHDTTNVFAVSFRLADYGLLAEFTLWVAGYGLRITLDQLNSYTWLHGYVI